MSRSWLDKLLGRPGTPDAAPERTQEHQQDLEALDDLRQASVIVHKRTDRLERELLRVNAELRSRRDGNG